MKSKPLSRVDGLGKRLVLERHRAWTWPTSIERLPVDHIPSAIILNTALTYRLVTGVSTFKPHTWRRRALQSPSAHTDSRSTFAVLRVQSSLRKTRATPPCGNPEPPAERIWWGTTPPRAGRRMAHRLALAKASPKMIDPAQIKGVSAPVHEKLPAELLGRIRLVRAALLLGYPHSLPFWLDGFSRDSHVTREAFLGACRCVFS